MLSNENGSLRALLQQTPWLSQQVVPQRQVHFDQRASTKEGGQSMRQWGPKWDSFALEYLQMANVDVTQGHIHEIAKATCCWKPQDCSQVRSGTPDVLAGH
jgi:hypothetical protein